MEVRYVMTVMAKDRPGLVESLARVVAANGGNWLESRMAHLGGHFAGILRVSVPGELSEKLLGALRGLEGAGIQIHATKDEAGRIGTTGRCAELSLVGQDRPGIVRQISQTLANKGVNVEELSTETSSAPMTGETLFHTQAEIRVPEGCTISDLQAELEKIASDLMVDIKVHELTKA